MGVQIGSTIYLLLLVTTTTAYLQYQTYIPNGQNVPNPCLPGTVWSGVGHHVPGGGGDRGPFGLAFAANNNNWTGVCPLDSDGDGRTNGQELGDPDCKWKKGMTSPPATGLSHPGICEPLHSNTCMSKNSWLTCPEQFNCPAVNQPDVRTATLRLPPTPVPAKETTNFRYGVFLPNDTDYSLIAFRPIINTSQVMHHMILAACTDDYTDYVSYKNPVETDMMALPNCTSYIVVWELGITGGCMASQFGFLLGTHGYKYAMLEIHWTNPTLATNFVDSSGFIIYYTPKLRPNVGGIFQSAQENLNIPPGREAVSFQGGCPSYCSSALPGTIYIAEILLHMHYLGRAGSVKLFRNGVLDVTLVDAPSYDCNQPAVVTFATPVAFNPGDSIVVTCTYTSINQTSVVTWGETVSSEMCLAFISYYPQNLQFATCSQWNTVNVCSNIPNKCSTNGFTELTQAVPKVCKRPGNCSSTCKLLMQAIVDTGCTTDDYNAYHSTYGTPGTKGLTDLISLCGVSANPMTVPPTTRSQPNSAEGLSFRKTLIIDIVVPAMSIILTIVLTAGFL